MSKSKRNLFSKSFALMLALIMMVSVFMPVTAFAMEAEPPASVAEQLEVDSGDISVLGTSGEAITDSEPVTESEPAPIDSEAVPITEDDGAAGNPDAIPSESAACAAPTAASGITPFSGWIDEGSEFYTKIRLTVKDNNGNPISGVVYGLYRSDNDSLVEYLTSDSYGVAESSDVPTDTDYYLVEYSVHDRWQSNGERKDIVLTEVCAPSRIDVTAEYDPSTGTIKIIKSDEYGERLEGVGFDIYSTDNGGYYNTVHTDANGEAVFDVPYGQYGIYESSYLPGYEGGGYHYASISYHGDSDTVYITNYLIRGYASLHKSGNDGRNIGGAVFSVYSADGDSWIENITTNSSGFAYTSNLFTGDYYLIEKSVPSPYAADTETKHHFTVSSSGSAAYFNIENPVDGESAFLMINKTDGKQNPLSDIVFGVYREWDDSKLFEITTGADGVAITPQALIPGDYYVLELVGKDGYTMHEGPIYFTVDGSGEKIVLDVENPKIRIFGKVKVIKDDDAGNLLDGVKFGVYCEYGNLLEELVTVDGTAISGILHEGNYYLKELCGIPGYLSSGEEYSFTISENNAVVTVNVTNPRITGFVKVNKTAEDEETPLSGVVFGIYEAGTDTKVCELTTTEDGTGLSRALYYGDYELRELSTVDGFELITTPIPVSISEQDVVIEISVTNPLIFGSVKVIKTEGEAAEDEAVLMSAENKFLANAVFGVYNSAQQKLGEITTGENGEAVYSGLPKGDFFLKELSAPESFIVDDTMIPFSITEQGEVVEITVANIKGYGTLKVVKHGEGNSLLSGVAFDVFRESTDEKVGEITTGENGEAEIILPLGRYYLKETKTDSNYILPEGTFSVILTADGETVVLELQNQKKPVTPAPDPSDPPAPITKGTLTVIKIADGTSEKLAGAVFGIYRVSDDVKVGEITTNSKGEASISLPAAEYYLKELKAPSNFVLSGDKIAVTITAGKNTEITVTNYAVPDDTETGTLRLIKKAEGTGKLLSDAVFGVYRASDNSKVAEITTNDKGEAIIDLEPDSYYLRELKAPKSFVAEPSRIPFVIKADRTVVVEVTNTQGSGTMLLIKNDEAGGFLSGAVFGIYKEDGTFIADITTQSGGKASYDLPLGRFYLVEKTAPAGFVLDSQKYSFTIENGKTVEIKVVNKAIVGTVEVYFKHLGDSRELAPMQSFTDKIGTDYIKWMREKGYENMPIDGYQLIRTDYPASLSIIDGKLIVTLWYDDGAPNTNITIPKTGITPPYLNYAFALLAFGAAAYFGAMYLRRKEQEQAEMM